MSVLNNSAQYIRSLCDDAGTRLRSGDISWRDELSTWHAQARENTDPFSRDDSLLRLALLESALADLDGRGQDCLDSLKRALDLIAQQKSRVQDADQLHRLHDQEWTLRLNFTQALRSLGRYDDAQAQVNLLEELAPDTLNPAHRTLATKLEFAALSMSREHYYQAAETYRSLQPLCRSSAPEFLGVVLLGTAQADMMLGDFAAAELNLNRAEPLLGADPTHIASLQHARAYLSLFASDPLDTPMRSFLSGEISSEAVAIDPRLAKQAALMQGHHQHVEGRVEDALHAFESLESLAFEHNGLPFLADVLQRSACVHQDLALTIADVNEASAHHRTALRKLTQARAIRLSGGHELSTASIDVTSADFLVQWHELHRAVTTEELNQALKSIILAVRTLFRASESIQETRTRHEFVRMRLQHAYEVACTLAFLLGNTRILSALIIESSARYDWRATQTA